MVDDGVELRLLLISCRRVAVQRLHMEGPVGGAYGALEEALEDRAVAGGELLTWGQKAEGMGPVTGL